MDFKKLELMDGLDVEVPRLRAEGASSGRQELQVRAMPYGETRNPVEEESEKEKATLLNHQSPTEGQLCASHGTESRIK